MLKNMNIVVRLCILVPIVTGCRGPDTVGYYHKSVIGFDASVSTQTTNASMILGYDRKMIAIVPKSEFDKTDDIRDYDAMSVISCTSLNASGLSLVNVDESLATGAAASSLTEKYQDDPGYLAKGSFACFK